MESSASSWDIFWVGSKIRDFHDFLALRPGFEEFDKFKVGCAKLYFSDVAMLIRLRNQMRKGGKAPVSITDDNKQSNLCQVNKVIELT